MGRCLFKLRWYREENLLNAAYIIKYLLLQYELESLKTVNEWMSERKKFTKRPLSLTQENWHPLKQWMIEYKEEKILEGKG